MTVLITRPKEDAKEIAEALEGAGVETLSAPMLKIKPLQVKGELIEAGGYVFTSTKGVANAPKSLDTRLPVYAVGKTTADAAREKGFWQISTAGGNLESLTRLLQTVWKSSQGDLLHLCGRHVKGDLKGELAKKGLTLFGVPVYEAEAENTLKADLKKALNEKEITVALFYSVRTITTFQNIIKKEKLEESCKNIKIYCLSKAIKKATNGFKWKSVKVTPDPVAEIMEQAAKETA